MQAHASSASWAVWGKVHPLTPFHWQSDIHFPEADPTLQRALHTRFVGVALNSGSAAVGGLKDWENFHGVARHGEYLLAEALRDTPAWGGYLTDLNPQITNSDRHRGRATPATITESIERLIDELHTLQADDPVIACIGNNSYDALLSNLRLLSSGLSTPRPRIVRIPHYSRSNGAIHWGNPARYRDLVLSLLNPHFDLL